MNNTIVIGNEEITKQVVSIREHRRSTIKERMEIGKMFSELRETVEKYTRTSKDKNKVSYADAVRLTGYARGTAELYRQMYEVCKTNGIPADVFVILAEAGFNLARDLNKDILPSAIFADNSKLKSEDYLLGLSEKETSKLIADLRKDYGKEDVQTVSIASLESEIASFKQEQSKSKKPEYKAFCQTQIDELTTTMHNKMLWALRNVASAFATLLGKDAAWVETYIEETKENTALTEQRYREAAVFAKRATFLGDVPKTKAPKKPSASVRDEQRQQTQAS